MINYLFNNGIPDICRPPECCFNLTELNLVYRARRDRGEPSTVAAVAAVVATLVSAVLTSAHDIAIAAANAASYGDETRYPLRTPPALFLGPLPLARLLVAASFVAGPLLLADGDVVLGIVALVVAVPVVYVLGRSLLGLAGRWAVLVPVGFVVVDPFTLSDPHLFLREHLRWMAPVTAGAGPRGCGRPAPRRNRRFARGALRLHRRPHPLQARPSWRRDGARRRDLRRRWCATRSCCASRRSGASRFGSEPIRFDVKAFRRASPTEGDAALDWHRPQRAMPPPTSSSPS